MLKKVNALVLVTVLLLAGWTGMAFAREEKTFTDDAGREVTLAADITRIAPSGNIAQIFLLAMAPEYFVGLSAALPKEAEGLLADMGDVPVLGQLYGNRDLNLEELLLLDPQVILDVGESKKSMAEDMDELQEQTGIPVIHIDAYMDSLGDTYRKLGDLLGLQERAEALAVFCETTYARVEEIIEGIGEDKAELLYVLGENGLNVIAKGSYHGELIDMLANNAAVIDEPSSRGTGDPVDMEQLLVWNPDILIFAPEVDVEALRNDEAWQGMQALENGKYAQVPIGPYNWMGFPPSAQRFLGMLWLCNLLYPSEAAYDLYEEAASYFSLFYHTELTREQFDTITQSARFE